MRHRVRLLLERLGQRGHQAGRNNGGARLAVRHHVGIVIGCEQGVDRHRDDASLQASQEGDRPVDAVLHQQQHPFFAAQAECGQAAGKTRHRISQPGITQRGGVVDVGDAIAPVAIQVGQVAGEIEAGRRCRGQGVLVRSSQGASPWNGWLVAIHFMKQSYRWSFRLSSSIVHEWKAFSP